MKPFVQRLLVIVMTIHVAVLCRSETSVVNGITWTYTVSNDEASLGSGSYSGSRAVPTSTTGTITIPDMLGGYPVTTIGEQAFRDCNKLTSVIIPDSVKSIKRMAFYGCSGLTSIDIPNNVTNILPYAFYGCSAMTAVRVPNGVTSIGEVAFRDCSRLSSVTIPDSVTSIGSSAFYNCTGLTEVTISRNVTSISGYMFYGCSKLATVSIPNGVKKINQYAFYNCSKLTFVSIPSSVTTVSSYAFANCPNYMNMRIAVSNITSWCSGAVNSNLKGYRHLFTPDGEKITTIVLPNEITSIGRYAFYNCPDLCSVLIPNTVTNMGYGAFYGCTNLTSITIPDGVDEIENHTFYNCSGLETAVIGSSVNTIGIGAFNGCTGLTSITIPNNVKSIYSRAFSGCIGLTSVLISDGVKRIESEAFWGCSGLVSITIPDSVTILGDRLFASCSGLKHIYLPKKFAKNTNIIEGIPSDCAVHYYVSLIVSSEHGTPKPSVGKNPVWGNSVTCSVHSPVIDENDSDVSYDCTGGKWMQNNQSTTFSGTSLTIPISTNDISLVWAWKTNVWVFGNGKALSWSGPFGTTEGWDYELWRGDAEHMSCLKSGAVTAGNASSLKTTVTGPGTLSFDWRISANRGDYCRFLLDDAETNMITRSTGWNSISLTIPSGNHSLEWRYERNSATAAGEDAAFLDNVEWIPGVTLTVASAYGTATPPVGQSRFTYNDSVQASVLAPEPSNGRKRVPIGWKGTGSVPATGTTTNVSFDITDNSSLTWQWKTQNRISVAVSGVGRCSFGSQWVDSGTTVTANIVPTKALYQISLSGDTDGVTLDGTRLSIPSDKPREIAVAVEEVKLHLDVVSGFGQPIPEIGRTEWSHGTVINAHASAPEPVNGTRRVCTGWVGMGSVPSSGTAADVTFTIVEDSSLTWNWRTEHLISLETEGEVESEFTQAWAASGTSIVVSYDITTSYAEIGLAGDSNGVTLDAMARTLTIPVDRPRAIILRTTRTLTLAEALDGTGIAWSTDPGTEWTAQTDVTFDGEDAGKSAFVSGNQVSGLTATIIGSGELRWRWMLNSSGVSGLDVFLDDNLGNPVFMFEEGGTWREAVLPILGDGAHTVRFEFWTSGQSPTDCAYLDSFSWTGDTLESSLAKALDATNLIWKTDEGWNWSVVKSNAFFGGEAARSASVGNGEVSGLETTVQGPGTLSWRWKLAIEGTAGMDVFVDEDTGSPMFAYDENGDWDMSSLSFDDNVIHTIRFEFWNVDDCPNDCAYLDKVAWVPAGSTTIDVDGVTIPVAWLDENAEAAVAAANGDYEAAARATASNGSDKVWQCYVSGVSPTNAAERFEARIGFENGEPVVTWTPDLNEGGTKSERVYTVEGKTNLVDQSWGPTNEATRFFRVKVQVP